MHTITGDRDTVKQLLEDTLAQFEKEQAAPGGARAGAAAVGGAPATAESEAHVDLLQETLDRVEGNVGAKTGARASAITRPDETLGRGVETSYAPRDRLIAVFQAAMDEYLDAVKGSPDTAPAATGGARAAGTAAPAATAEEADVSDFYDRSRPRPTGRGGVAAADLLVKYGKLDPHWVEVVREKLKLLLRGKHAFTTHASASDFRFTMADKTTIAIVGDWGGGNQAAQAVAKQIAQLAPDHVIHLGDVYYAGTPKEVQERFLRYWPTPRAPGHSFALNSNHEMYSGGYGYFDYTLRTFRQPASYFSLANAHWQFIGLDTGYDEHDLHPPQTDWLGQQLGAGPKTILLSHHQLFSAYERTDASKLRAKVQPFLARIYGWIWGHEHLAVVYELHEGIKAVCLGNGCFPYDFPSRAPSVPVKWIDRRTVPDPDYPGGHTFALLKLDGPRIDIDFIDERGAVGYRETWT